VKAREALGKLRDSAAIKSAVEAITQLSNLGYSVGATTP
jgi:hypothetical protein